MSSASAASRDHATLRTRLSLSWRRLRPALLLALPIVFGLVAFGFAISAWRIHRADTTIATLANGKNVAVASDANPAVMLARVLFLARRDRLEEAAPLVEAIGRAGEPDLTARAHFVVANSRLRQAFGHLARNDLDPAGPLVVLARQDYRLALQARPDFWDAKFNLDVASRLIRDFPDFDRKHGDDLQAEPKKIWTDIPGQPRGAP